MSDYVGVFVLQKSRRLCLHLPESSRSQLRIVLLDDD